jgi:hypothetical protein
MQLPRTRIQQHIANTLPCLVAVRYESGHTADISTAHDVVRNQALLPVDKRTPNASSLNQTATGREGVLFSQCAPLFTRCVTGSQSGVLTCWEYNVVVCHLEGPPGKRLLAGARPGGDDSWSYAVANMTMTEEFNMVLTAEIKTDDGQTIGTLLLDPKKFKTGNTGFFAQGKLVIEGKRYQVQCQAVLIKGQAAEPERSVEA